MQSSGVLAIYLIFYMSQLGSVICEGDHAHVHEEAAAGATHSTSTGPQGTVTTVHTTSGDSGGGSNEGFASILSSISPDLISRLASNPQVAQALKSSGVDVGATTAAKAAAEAGGRVAPGAGGYNYPSAGGYDYPAPPVGGLGGFGGGIPFFGPYKQLHVSGDFGAYYPFVEKAIIIFGGGIIILVIIALLSKALAKGGLFYNLGSSISEALAGSASVDIGPFHKSVAGAGAVNAGFGAGRGGYASTPNNLMLTQQVHDSLDQRF